MKYIFLIFCLINTANATIKYRTSFGSCPSRTAGSLTLKLVKIFEVNSSLKDVKDYIRDEKIMDKYFLSNYQINYDPLKKIIGFNLECPKPLMKVQIYKRNAIDSYDAILVENGRLYDPTYLVLLKEEKKIKKELPFLALPVGNLKEEIRLSITGVVMGLNKELRAKLAEVILNESNELTIIFSMKGNATSVFFGEDAWNIKIKKLQKIVRYMQSKKRMPSIINLTHSKKIVVKFKDKI
ncbi:MAG: hypothetical protein DRQ88_05230 [Epsilonproteobacteria bacterium]|nr:MAG: hypothetical protein DRQ89_04525 [Campylobacterota bacterium]RLA66831.1 MAG: hypothetical protein DRQ88_05230 [Campylobacterota bacterium]